MTKIRAAQRFSSSKKISSASTPKAAITVPLNLYSWAKCEVNSRFSSPSRVTLASWRHFAAIRPPRDRYLNVPYRTTPATLPCNKQERCLRSAFSGAASRLALECLLHLSCAYVHGCLLFSLLCSATGERRRHSFSGNARRSPGRRKRESPVLQSRSGGPEGRSSVTLRTIPRSFTLFSLPYRSSCREFAFGTSRASFLSSSSSGLVSALSLSAASVHTREFSSVPFCEVNCLRRIVDGLSVVYMYPGTRISS